MNGIHDQFLVGASVLVAILASYTALDLARSITSSVGRARNWWLVGGSLAMGFGIWSMHFIGMLAFAVPGISIAYDVKLLILSILVAVAASAIALWVASRRDPTLRYFVYGGIAMGAAICGMHYIGMAGIRTAAFIEWRAALVFASIVIAVAASFAGLWLAFRFRSVRSSAGHRYRLGAAVVMGLAIAGMHYTAMAAAVFVPTGRGAVIATGDLLATEGLGVAVLGSTLLILALALIGSVIERELVRRSTVASEIERLYGEAQAEIRERQRVERALREQDERLRLALDAGAMGTWEWDESTDRLIMSDACREMHGLPDDFDGQRQAVDAAVHPEDRLKVRTGVVDLLENGTPYEGEYRVPFPDGSLRWIRLRGRRYRDASARRTIGICADVTARRTLEDQLRQSQKLEAIGHLAGGIAHDFNNVLTAVQGHVELLLESLAENDPRREDVEEIQRASRRAADLTAQLLAFARRQMIQPRHLDLAELAAETEPMLRRLLGEDITLVTHFEAGGTGIRADPTQVDQIVMNLAVNARDAMPQGGRITLEVAPRTIRDPVPVIGDRIAPGDYVVLSLADEGVGIESGVLEHIFEPFFTTKPKGKGTGLGLSTVHGIVSQTGGYIAVDTRPGEGTTFEVFFPAVVGPVPAVDAARSAQTRAHRAAAPADASLLVVEDESSVRNLIHRVLRLHGYRVNVAASGDEALRLLNGDQIPCDLLISDVVMPGMSGPQLFERVTVARPELPVLFISGYTEDTIIRREIEGAEVDFLQKPFTPEELVTRVATMLGR